MAAFLLFCYVAKFHLPLTLFTTQPTSTSPAKDKLYKRPRIFREVVKTFRKGTGVPYLEENEQFPH
jgi:hypothetical protein